jgi:hypothetical protein
MAELESEEKQRPTTVLRVLLLLCWAVVLAKTYFLIRGHPTPAVIEYSYIVALPTVLWNLKPGLDILGTWFYIAVMSVIGLGIVFWVVRQWRRYILEDPEKAWPLGWTIGTSILAINFVILIFFVGRELLAASARAEAEKKLHFEEPPTHPPPDEAPPGAVRE